ncbi:MAG TPA: hypothetical protein VFB95_02300 [Candidatus Cryosericum sp.]|nr:hypothetical protein [Candidatus Cryosericum sp.]
MKRPAAAIILLVLALLHGRPARSEPPAAAKAEPPAAKSFTTRHEVVVGKAKLAYRVMAEETYLRDREGKPEASIFSTAYVLDRGGDAAARPIAFLFNGGPGSSSVWLHLGAFGPLRVDIPSDPVNPGAPPYRLAPNPQTLLPATDLVFVDPVGTGYSRALGEKKDVDYWGVDEDAAATAAFVREYLTRHKRWASPKYIVGESYGTIRASLLVRDLQLGPLNNVSINGVVLVSAALDVRVFQSGVPGNDLAYVTSLPTYAATAYYHKALDAQPADLEAFLQKARRFASTEYVTALFQGDPMPEDRARQIAQTMHDFTGLSTEFLRRSRFRVSAERFRKELLRARGLTVGAHDTRFVGKDPDDAGEAVEIDPFIRSISGPFVTAMNSYLTDELGVEMDRPYEVFQMAANRAWKRPEGESWVDGYLYTLPFLAQAAAVNSGFRVFVASGYHDLTTTFFGAEHQIQSSGIDPKRVTNRNYEGGHMMYLDAASRARLSADVAAFIQGR